MKIPINEIYNQLTIQGEGKRAGRLCTFIRTNFCNLRCAFKDGGICDTPYTSHNPEKGKLMEVDDVLKELLNVINKSGHNVDDIIITGGEPYMHEGLIELVNKLEEQGFYVTIETNGTIFRKVNADLISISPKLVSSIPKDEELRKVHVMNRNYNYSINEFEKFNKNIQYKFVYTCKEDIDEINDFCEQFAIPKDRVWLMPEGADLKSQIKHTKETMDKAIENGFNFTSRLHILAYGDKRGV
jgi:7-carboxy-7-deazaguanine synthase